MAHQPESPDPQDTAAQATAAEIARRHLCTDTLDTRHSDGLDFRELAVWNIRDALLAAYAAGAATTAAQPPKEA